MTGSVEMDSPVGFLCILIACESKIYFDRSRSKKDLAGASPSLVFVNLRIHPAPSISVVHYRYAEYAALVPIPMPIPMPMLGAGRGAGGVRGLLRALPDTLARGYYSCATFGQPNLGDEFFF